MLVGLLVLAFLIWFPQTEGRAQNLDMLSIYADPFILYGYAASTLFFIALFKAFRLLGYIRQNRAFSIESVKTLRTVRYCTIVLGILILMAAFYIWLVHYKDDDPAGFLAMCIVTTFVALVVAAAVAVLENILQNGMDVQSQNEALYGQSK